MTVRILQGDCREVLRTLADASVQCIVTSPPYFGLRDYGTGTWVGGDPGCAHGVRRWEGEKQTQGAQSGKAAAVDRLARERCACGATRVDRQIGLEPTPEAFIAGLLEVFRECRRVLRDDGTLWLNMGDSYHSTSTYNAPRNSGGAFGRVDSPRQPNVHGVDGLKPKDLIGIPWMLAFALRADGWYLRQDIIWAKPNPIPESVRDRCTKAHEYLFLLSKSPRYYFDAEAIAEPIADSSVARLSQPNLENQAGSDRVPGKTNGAMKAVGPRFGGNKYGDDDREESRTKSGNEWTGNSSGRRNKRSVWTVSTKPFKEAHFATFPPDLIKPCILAGCPEGGVVLDPFGGAGTTGLVADRLQRDAILIELNPEYIDIARRRIAGDAPLFTETSVEMTHAMA